MFIYLIRNTVNNKVYVGKTERTIAERFGEHVEAALYTPRAAPFLYRAIRKYGVASFIVTELESCSAREQLDARECYWISKLQACDSAFGYNLTTGGVGGRLTGEAKEKHKLACKKTQEHKIKISLAHKALGTKGTDQCRTPAASAKKGLALRGRKFSPETIQRMKESGKIRANSKEGLARLVVARASRKPLEKDVVTGQFLPKGGK